jgi:hypothetical protein
MKYIECTCKNMAMIDGKQIEHGHHVNCDANSEKIEMAKITFDGVWCIMNIEDAFTQLMEASGDDEYTFQKVYMTQNEFNALPEFTGW